MANVQRLKRGDGKPVRMIYPASVQIDVGDLLFEKPNPSDREVLPASSQTDETTPAGNRRVFASRFAGVAADQHLSTDTSDRTGSVWTEGEFEFPCESTVYEVGDLFGVSENAGGNGLDDQELVKVVDMAEAVACAVERAGSATTTVRVRLLSSLASYRRRLVQAVAEEMAWHGISDDFDHYTTTEDWTTVASDSGTVAAGAAKGGVVTLTPSDGTVADNDETYIKGTHETYKFEDGKPIVIAARVKCNQTTADTTNLIVGVKDAVAADTLQDNGAGPPASYSGVLFFKADGGGDVWQSEVSVAGTQVTDTNAGAFSDNAWQDLFAVVEPISATQAIARFWVDGVLGATSTFTYTSGTEMQACCGVKLGAATNNDLLLVDYFRAKQLR